VHKSLLESEWLTKICVSEGNFNRDECKKLLQSLENMRDMRPDKSLLSAMYAQSAKITRQDPFTDPRQIWISYLPMRGTEPPEKGWVECTGKDPQTKRAVPAGCTGTWSTTVLQWVPFRKDIRALYFSGIVPDAVPGKPIQWGGDMDYWRGVDRGFCPLNVGGLMHNTYWGDPKDPANAGKCLPIDHAQVKKSRSISATIASGRERRKTIITQRLSDEDG
jgi:hypothetical protein